jgi:hypothetical protein
MTALMRPNPVRPTLQAGGTAYGTMAFEFFSPDLMTILAAAGDLRDGAGSQREPFPR